MTERSAMRSPPTVNYDHNYSNNNYKYEYPATTEQASGASTVDPSSSSTSSLNLLSCAASAVSAHHSTPPAAPPEHCSIASYYSYKHQHQHHQQRDGRRSPTRTTTTSPRSSTFPVAPSPSSEAPRPPTNTILAVFPKLSPSASASSIPMPPGMEITLSHNPPKKMNHHHPRSKSEGRKSTASSSSSNSSNKTRTCKYRMKYSFLSMTREAAHRYIAELEHASNYGSHAGNSSNSSSCNTIGTNVYPGVVEVGTAHNRFANTMPARSSTTNANLSSVDYSYTTSRFKPNYRTYMQYG